MALLSLQAFVLGFVFCVTIYKLYWHPTPTAKVPGVGYGKSPIFASWRGAIKFMLQPRGVLSTGYKKYKKSYFKISTLREEHVMVSDREKIAEEMLSAWTIGDHTPWHRKLISGKLTQNIGSDIPATLAEIEHALDKYIGAASDWTDVHVWDVVSKLVAQTISRAFIGPSLCRNDEYLDIVISFPNSVDFSAAMIRLVPEWLKPYATRITPSWRQRKAAEELMKDEILKRLRLSHKLPKDKPDDLLQWVVDASPARERTVNAIVERIMGLNIAAIPTTAASLTAALAHVAAKHYKYIPPLRQELKAKMEQHGQLLITQHTLASIILLDSILRESGRLNLASLIGLPRVARRDFRFRDGTLVPAGTRVGVPAISIHRDSALYIDPDQFDGFRFARLRENVKDGTRYQYATTELDYLTFGHGKYAVSLKL